MFKNVYKGKKVLVTGHTGFKGTWLVSWLLDLGADVIGYSDKIPTNPSMFEILGLESKIKHILGNVNDLSAVKKVINTEKPDFVFHLAAQPIVSISYEDPVETIESNVMGTVHVLEALRSVDFPCTAIFITSDKAYENVEQIWGYKENDRMGGKDVYSGSKGAAELMIRSYFMSFFKDQDKVRLAIGRAGNVIGGGDWAKDRIVVDCMQSWSLRNAVEIRSPYSTRPWQHVLEPLSGYLDLGSRLYSDNKFHGEAFNFGPNADQNHTVEKLLIDLSAFWNFDDVSEAYQIIGKPKFAEANLLKLNCDKALFFLNWTANLAYDQTVEFTSKWYYGYYMDKEDMYAYTMNQIKKYCEIANDKGLAWAKK